MKSELKRRRHGTELVRPRRRLAATESEGVVLAAVRSFDLFPKVAASANDLSTRVSGTGFGGLLSIPVVCVLCWLCASELWRFVSPTPVSTMTVDTMFAERLSIEMDIEFPALACESLGVDVMDVTGFQQVHVSKSIRKVRLDRKTGRSLGEDHSDEHYAEESAMVPPWLRAVVGMSSHKVHVSEKIEGCRLMGSISAQKVSGNFHMALGAAVDFGGRHVHQFVHSDIGKFNTSHIIHSLSFGPRFPTQSEPLRGSRQLLTTQGSAAFQYKLKVIPTVYESVWGFHTYSHQFTHTLKTVPIDAPQMGQRMSSQLPGVFFIYEMTPFMMKISQLRPSFFQFLIHLSAIAGGFYAVFQMFDSVVFNMTLQKGHELVQRLVSPKMASFDRIL